MVKAGCWEPYELRGSRTVLGARGGEIPPRDSLAALSPGRNLLPRRGEPGDLDPFRLGWSDGGSAEIAGRCACRRSAIPAFSIYKVSSPRDGLAGGGRWIRTSPAMGLWFSFEFSVATLPKRDPRSESLSL